MQGHQPAKLWSILTGPKSAKINARSFKEVLMRKKCPNYTIICNSQLHWFLSWKGCMAIRSRGKVCSYNRRMPRLLTREHLYNIAAAAHFSCSHNHHYGSGRCSTCDHGLWSTWKNMQQSYTNLTSGTTAALCVNNMNKKRSMVNDDVQVPVKPFTTQSTKHWIGHHNNADERQCALL